MVQHGLARHVGRGAHGERRHRAGDGHHGGADWDGVRGRDRFEQGVERLEENGAAYDVRLCREIQ